MLDDSSFDSVGATNNRGRNLEREYPVEVEIENEEQEEEEEEEEELEGWGATVLIA